MVERWDETWHRLQQWTGGQGPSERLAAQVLLSEGYSVNPSHPLGGPDGGADALAERDGRRWVMAVYFPRGVRQFSAVRRKVLDDFRGVAQNDAEGLLFVTNQELTRSEREALADAVDGSLEIYHLERVVALLDQPSMSPTRTQFLGYASSSGASDEWLEPRPLELEWEPDTQAPGAMVVSGGFLVWPVLRVELRKSVLPRIDEVPEGCDVALADLGGKRNWLIQIVDNEGRAIGFVWIGQDPRRQYAFDGRIHLGSLDANPLEVWASYQRWSNGQYRRIEG